MFFTKINNYEKCKISCLKKRKIDKKNIKTKI